MNNNSISSAERSSVGSSKTYILVTAFLSLFAIVGFALYGLPFFYDFWAETFEWSRKTITSGNALSKLLVAPLFGFIAGWMIDRYGPRKLMMAGAVFAGIAMVGLSTTGGSLSLFYMFYVFNALGYVFAGPLPCQVLISRWFEKNRGKAMGIAYLGIGAGGTLVPLLANAVESRFGWNTAMIVLGVCIVLIAMPFAYFIREPKNKEVKKAAVAPPASIKSILTNRNFYFLLLTSICSIGVVGGVNQHLKLYLRDLEFTQELAAQIISLVLMSSMIGRLTMGFLADLFTRKYVMIFINLITASSIIFLLLPDFPGRIYIFSVVFGIGLGGEYMIIPLVAGDLFGVRVLGRTMGIILVVDGIAESLFPVWVASTVDNTGNYMLGFTLLICVAVTGAIIATLLPKKGSYDL